jgi:hypothetical protein
MFSLNLIKPLSKFVVSLILFSILIQCSEDEVLKPEAELATTPSPDPEVTGYATASSVPCSSCNYVVPGNKTTIDGKALGFKPGWVICLNSDTNYPYLTLTNVVGTSSNPIIITNCGGEVTIDAPGKPFVLKVANSKHFRLTGGNVNNGYGIKLTGASTNGLVLGPLTTNFEIDHIEAFQVGFAGIMAKTDPTCDDATIRDNFTMRNVSFHHNYVHDTGGEGFYIGHTAFNGAKTSCGTRLPHVIENVQIYRNLVRNSGWDAIQLSSATVGASIAYNRVENYSTKNNPDQSGGISLGGGTGGVCHSNIIKSGNGSGMVVFGLADNLIHNNIIVNPKGMGIFCDERTAPGAGYRFVNNTIINPKTEGIRLYSDQVPMNTFINNIIVNPGSYATMGDRAYVYLLSSNVKLTSSNNYFTRDINKLKFINPSGSNYRLNTGSPAIDKGRDISAYSITKDYYSASRLKGAYYDIGASEFQQ